MYKYEIGCNPSKKLAHPKQKCLQVRHLTSLKSLLTLNPLAIRLGCSQALEIMTEQQTEDANALPIFYNAEDNQFYEL